GGLWGTQDRALAYPFAHNWAEKSGKRLPTSDEWERTQSVLPPRTSSDLGEWTSTLQLVPDDNGKLTVRGRAYREYRIVRGGSLSLVRGNTDLSPRDYDARNLLPVPAAEGENIDSPAIAVRYVRSAKPRFSLEQ